MSSPFDGLRAVLVDPSPAVGMAGWLLSRMGADVTLLEPADGGRLRRQPPFVDDRSALFDYLSAGMCLARLDGPDQNLPVADVHVVLHGFTELPQRWRASLTETSVPPRGRVVVACTPYGQLGPHRDWRASEVTLFQAGGEGFLMPSGLAFEQFPERPPIGVGRYLAHYQGGVSAAIASLAGLRTSRATGETEWADVSIQDIEVSLNYFTVSRFVEGVTESRANRAFRYGGVLRCRDGFVELLTLEQRQWQALREMMGDPEWARAERLHDAVSRGQHGDEVNQHLRAWAAERGIAEIVELAARHGVPCGPFLTPVDLPLDAQLQSRGYFVSRLDASGTRVTPGTPWRLSDPGSGDTAAAPAGGGESGDGPSGRDGVRRPLDGVRIVDFTNHAAGPYCAMVLGLLGAEIIRIESNARLDIQRRPHPVYGRLNVPTFDYLGTHKKSITLNLKRPEARDLAQRLVDISDVVLENFRPGVMERLGLSWEHLSPGRPDLVMMSLSAYGQAGPLAKRPGYAPIFAAEGGLGYLTGYPDGPPGEIRNLMDHQAGLVAAYTVLSLLEARGATGRGGHVDLAAREVAVMLVGESVLAALDGGESERIGNDHELWAPHGVYPVAGEDRWVALAVRDDDEWRRLVELMGHPSWCEPGWADQTRRHRDRHVIDERLGGWTRGQRGEELVARLQAAGLTADRSMTAADILADAHLRERGSVTVLHHGEHGERHTVGSPWRFANADAAFRQWSPALGQHNTEIIQGLLGVPGEEYDRWVRDGVIF